MPVRITLIGYRASGKTTVGRLLAARLAWPFVDSDHEIEQRLGGPISGFFQARGEAAFRDFESEVLAEILGRDGPLVLATGGGAVLREANRELLRRRGGQVVWLDVPPVEVQDRLRHHPGGRPSLTGGDVAAEAARLMAEREPHYRAVATLRDPGGPTPAAVADRLLGLLGEG